MVKSTDALGNYSTFEYYKDGQKKSIKAYAVDNSLLSTVNYKRKIGAENGKYIALTEEVIGDANGPTQSSTVYVNKHGFVEKNTVIVDSVPQTEYYTYDYMGRALTFKSARIVSDALPIDYTWKKEYDFAGNVVKFFNADGNHATHVYNSLGQLKESYDFKSNQETVPYASKKTYDKVGRLIKEEVPFEKSGSTVQYSVKEYLYSPLGQVIEERTSINKPNEAKVMRIQRYTYDDMNRLVMVRLENPGKTPVITQYYYDAVGNQVRMYTGLSSPYCSHFYIVIICIMQLALYTH